MSDDLTAPLGTVGETRSPGDPGPFPTPGGSGTDLCPNGHVVPVEQIMIRNGHKVCPICEAQARAWSAPAARPPLYWSRKVLRVPLALIAAAFFVGALSAAFDIATSASYVTNHLPGAGSTVFSSIFNLVSDLGVAVGAGWVAYLVGLDGSPPPPSGPGDTA
jgi:hypothetical protein